MYKTKNDHPARALNELAYRVSKQDDTKDPMPAWMAKKYLERLNRHVPQSIGTARKNFKDGVVDKADLIAISHHTDDREDVNLVMKLLLSGNEVQAQCFDALVVMSQKYHDTVTDAMTSILYGMYGDEPKRLDIRKLVETCRDIGYRLNRWQLETMYGNKYRLTDMEDTGHLMARFGAFDEGVHTFLVDMLKYGKQDKRRVVSILAKQSVFNIGTLPSRIWSHFISDAICCHDLDQVGDIRELTRCLASMDHCTAKMEQAITEHLDSFDVSEMPDTCGDMFLAASRYGLLHHFERFAEHYEQMPKGMKVIFMSNASTIKQIGIF